MNRKQNNNRGLTLLELIVSIGVFALIMLSVMSIFISVTRTQRRNTALQNNLDSIRYTLEVMSKEVRMAIKDVDGSCHEGEVYYQKNRQEIFFLDYQGKCVTYFLNGKKLFKEVDSGGEIQVTPDKVLVDDIDFEIFSDINSQPMVKIALKFVGEGQDFWSSPELVLQTTISSRFYY